MVPALRTTTGVVALIGLAVLAGCGGGGRAGDPPEAAVAEDGETDPALSSGERRDPPDLTEADLPEPFAFDTANSPRFLESCPGSDLLDRYVELETRRYFVDPDLTAVAFYRIEGVGQELWDALEAELASCAPLTEDSALGGSLTREMRVVDGPPIGDETLWVDSRRVLSLDGAEQESGGRWVFYLADGDLVALTGGIDADELAVYAERSLNG